MCTSCSHNEQFSYCMYAHVVVAVCRVQCVDSHVQKGDLDKTAPRNVSVTTTASVCHLLDSVSAALDTQENGKSNFYNVPYSIQQCVELKLDFKALEAF